MAASRVTQRVVVVSCVTLSCGQGYQIIAQRIWDVKVSIPPSAMYHSI